MKKLYKSFALAALIVALLAANFLTGSFSNPVTRSKATAPDNNFSANANDAEPCFLVLSDIHLCDDKKQFDVYSKRGDSGEDLWDTVQKKIRNLLSTRHPKFIILLGDLPIHTDDRQLTMHNMSVVLNNIQKLAGDVPVIYAPGNNDSPYGHNAFYSLYFIHNHGTCDTCWPYFHSGAGNHSPIMDYDTSLGCYSCYPLDKPSGAATALRVIVLNTVVFMNTHTPRTGTTAQAEATREMDWLQNELAGAAKSNDKIILAMHVPAGKDYMGKDFWDTLKYTLGTKTETVQNAFLDMIAQYKERIVGVFASHTHLDGVRKLYAGEPTKFIALGISVPGVAPGHGNYPGLDVVNYNPENYALLNFETYYLPYEHAYAAGKPLTNTWEKLNFNALFRNNNNIPLRQFLETLNDDSLQHPIFLRENESVMKFIPDKGVEVREQ